MFRDGNLTYSDSETFHVHAVHIKTKETAEEDESGKKTKEYLAEDTLFKIHKDYTNALGTRCSFIFFKQKYPPHMCI